MQNSFELTVALKNKEGEIKGVVVPVNQADTIKNVKDKIEKETGINVEHQVIMRDSSCLNNERTVAYYGLNKYTVLLLFCKTSENSKFFENFSENTNIVNNNTTYSY